jgi:hypothetical protein
MKSLFDVDNIPILLGCMFMLYTFLRGIKCIKTRNVQMLYIAYNRKDDTFSYWFYTLAYLLLPIVFFILLLFIFVYKP